MANIEINGKHFEINIIETRNRNAYGRLKGETILITVPSRWPRKDKEKTVSSLLKRTIKEIERGKWTPEGSKKLEFDHGQTINVLGKDYEIEFIPSKRFGGRIKENKIEIKIAEHPKIKEKASETVRKQIIKMAMPDVRARIDHFNSIYFNAGISRVTLRDNTHTWGSCSRDGYINLNVRLLFMPQEILDYVIVHELAHTKYLSHGKRFWGLVEKVLPDYETRRNWLRDHGWSIVPQKRLGQQKITNFLNEILS